MAIRRFRRYSYNPLRSHYPKPYAAHLTSNFNRRYHPINWYPHRGRPRRFTRRPGVYSHAGNFYAAREARRRRYRRLALWVTRRNPRWLTRSRSPTPPLPPSQRMHLGVPSPSATSWIDDFIHQPLNQYGKRLRDQVIDAAIPMAAQAIGLTPKLSRLLGWAPDMPFNVPAP